VPNWFLPLGTPGSLDEWCFQTVPTAELRVYPDTAAYHDRLASLLSQSKTNHEIFLIGWMFNLDGVLTPKKSLLVYLEAARGRGARVRLLAPPSHSGGNNATQVSNAVAKKIDALIDDQLPKAPPNDAILIHQKAVFIKLEKNSHLFVGGMDIARPIDEWFDVQVEIIGLGASLGRKTLEERWESLKPPLGGLKFTSQPIVPSGKGDAHQVQFVRTYPPFPTDLTNWKRTYAPKGDHTYYALISQAISLAQTSIYIEEQMLWTTGPAPTRNNPAGGSSPKERSDVPDPPNTLEQLLASALGRGVRLVVISSSDNTQRRKDVVTMLANANARNPPILLQALPTAMFVHSKTWIFDDQFVVVGSANFWDRSYHSVNVPAEGEFGVGFTSKVDGTSLGFPGVSFARALRILLWERIRQDVDINFTFPRNASASFDDEVRELRKPSNGTDPFQPMGAS
jgi:phosphatidylserine/phosphatidylglycerophosphate/cardiolipin synthase-like enzyme